jgi:hypothetical protein
MERHYLATLNARLRAEHCPSIHELTALVEHVVGTKVETAYRRSGTGFTTFD